MSLPIRLTSPPWSKKALRALGEALRDGQDVPEKAPDYEDVLAWYLDFSDDVLQHIEGLDWKPLGLRAMPGTSRPKTRGTLIDKLQRDHSTPLPNIGDLAGVRIDADMTLSVQTEFAKSLKAVLDDEIDPSGVLIKDLRSGEHSGYRAVHVLTTFPAGRCEIQLRTRLQSAWANVYELLAIILGREIRYGALPSDKAARELVTSMHHQSKDLASFEAHIDRLGHLSRNSDSVDDSTRETLGTAYTENKEIERQIVESLHATERELLAKVKEDRND